MKPNSKFIRSMQFAVLALSVTHTHASTGLFETIALSEQAAPGTSLAFSRIPPFSTALLNNEGRVIFQARLDTRGILSEPEGGIWVWDAGQLQPLALDKQQTPGQPVGQLWSMRTLAPLAGSLTVGDNNKVAFTSTLTTLVDPSTEAGQGIWQGAPGHLRTIAVTGQQASGMATGRTFQTFNFSTYGHPLNGLNLSGGLVFGATVSNPDGSPSDENGVWIADANGITPVVLSGQQVPGQEPGVVYDYVSISGGLTSQGGYMHSGVYHHGQSHETRGYWVGGPGTTPRRIIQTGDRFEAVDELGNPYIYEAGLHLSQAVFNNAGQVLFIAGDSGLWFDDDGVRTPIAITHSQAPGQDEGTYFDGFRFYTPPMQLNGAGELAFIADLERGRLTEDTRSSLWFGTKDDLVMIPPTDFAVPGAPGAGLPAFQKIQLNEAGTLAITGLIRDGTSIDYALWITRRDGPTELILDTTTPIEVVPGDIRRPRSLALLDFNDNDQALVLIQFNDMSTGLFLVNVPEPATGILLLLSLGLYRPRRR